MTIFEKTDRYKAALDGLRPFEEPVLRQLRDYYRVGLTWSSNALEGNTLTEVDGIFCEFLAERVFECQKEIARLLHVSV